MTDTAVKRRSAMGIRGLAIGRLVPPDGEISTTDRRGAIGLYTGIETQIDTFFFWRDTGDSSRTWVETGDSDRTWVETGDGSSSWTPVPDFAED